jgi:hypothetical protein
MAPHNQPRRPGTRKKAVRPVKTLSAAAWAQLTIAIRQLAQAPNA